MEGWKVCDLSMTLIVDPYSETGSNVISVAYYQVGGASNYFWLAPSSYTGKHLTSYGSTVTFSLSWDIMRGDTSGKPTTSPDLVLVVSEKIRLLKS